MISETTRTTQVITFARNNNFKLAQVMLKPRDPLAPTEIDLRRH